jgi:tetratricopeptide (TPR) repeat protein
MLFRSSTLFFARGLAHANLGDITLAKKEADQFDSIRQHPLFEQHILHNNSVSALLAVDAPMLRGDIAYREGQHEKAFQLLREAVQLQGNLLYDEPWGKMQPIRHALGGLLLEQGHFKEAEEVFRENLKFHPKNPWALVGLIQCLKKKSDGDSCCNGKKSRVMLEVRSWRLKPY